MDNALSWKLNRFNTISTNNLKERYWRWGNVISPNKCISVSSCSSSYLTWISLTSWRGYWVWPRTECTGGGVAVAAAGDRAAVATHFLDSLFNKYFFNSCARYVYWLDIRYVSFYNRNNCKYWHSIQPWPVAGRAGAGAGKWICAGRSLSADKMWWMMPHNILYVSIKQNIHLTSMPWIHPYISSSFTKW